MSSPQPKKPSKQQLRTRRDLLRAAARLAENGVRPTMEEIADEAMVSRATIYRYYNSVDALLAEVEPDLRGSEGSKLFADNPPSDPEARIDMVEEFFHRLCYDHEAVIRVQVAASIITSKPGSGVPVRQNRRMPMIEEALKPIKGSLSKTAFDRLCASLAFIIGTESMIVCQDVIHLDKNKARRTKSWAVRALVRQALAESAD